MFPGVLKMISINFNAFWKILSLKIILKIENLFESIENIFFCFSISGIIKRGFSNVVLILERIFPLSTKIFHQKFKSTFLGRQKELRAQIFTQVRSLRVFLKSDVDFSKSDVDFQNFGTSREKNIKKSKFEKSKCVFF